MWEVVHKQGWPWKNWCFWIVVIEDNLESPLDNKSILKEINPEYSLEELMLMLKLQYFGQLMQILDSLGETLMLERLRAREEGDRRWHGYIVLLNGHEFGQTPGDNKGQGSLACHSPSGCKQVDTTSEGTAEYIYIYPFFLSFTFPT